MKQTVYYQVRATEFVAREMLKYEGNTVVFEGFPECKPSFIGTDLEVEYTTKKFVVKGTPNISRWKSFGVTVSAFYL